MGTPTVISGTRAVVWGSVGYVLAGVLAIVLLVRRRQKVAASAPAAELSPQEQQRLDDLLNKKSQDD